MLMELVLLGRRIGDGSDAEADEGGDEVVVALPVLAGRQRPHEGLPDGARERRGGGAGTAPPGAWRSPPWAISSCAARTMRSRASARRASVRSVGRYGIPRRSESWFRVWRKRFARAAGNRSAR